jgi:Ig-like domain CHU_C associated
MLQLLQNRYYYSSVGKLKKFHPLNVFEKRKATMKLLFTLLLIGISLATQAQCPTAPGDQTSYGSSSWIGYVYSSINSSNPPTNAFTTTYRGYVTQPETFDQNIGAGSISGANVCGNYSNAFSIRFKMQKNFPAGYYKFTVGGGDGFRLSLDGGATFIVGDFTDHGYYTLNSTSLYLSGSTNLVLEYYERSGNSRVSFDYTYCPGYSTAPTSIAGTTTICNGSSTTLTATGGTEAAGAIYEWGTGTFIGGNIITGQTSASITVSPTSNKTYWVKRIDPAGCNNSTSGITQLVTVVSTSTAPTSISGTTSICQGSSTTLSSNGGFSATGAVYEWGTGTVVGTNIIAGQTSSSITVTPTASTTYWVRRVDVAPCSTGTAGVTTTVTVTPIDGDETTYGTGSWIGYVYYPIDSANPPVNAYTSIYRGYLTQPEIFDQNIGNGSISGPTLCGTYNNGFGIRFKMERNFPAGYYTFHIGGGDGYRLSLDGGATFIVNNYSDHTYLTSNSSQYYLSGITDLVIEYYERSGSSRVSFNYTYCPGNSTAATSIDGITTICNGTSTTLTATGGTEMPGATYEWGSSSTVGNNVIFGQTGASITVSPTSTKTYWVRRIDPSPCSNTSAGITQMVTVINNSTAPTFISGNSTVCLGNSVTLSANGGTAAAGVTYEWGTGTIVGTNTIAGETANTMTIIPTGTTTYWVRRIDTTPCTNTTNGVTATVNVNVPNGDEVTYGTNSWIGYVYSSINSTNPPTNAFTTTYRGYITQPANFNQDLGTGSISGINVCGSYNDQFAIRFKMQKNFTAGYYTFTVGGDDGYRLSLDGGATFPIDSFVDHTYATSTPASFYLSGTTNLVLEYYEQTGSSRVSINYTTCGTYSTAPTSITGTTTICNGTGGTTLTAIGGTGIIGSNYQWGTGTVSGNNAIAGATSATYLANPSSTTTYWVRIIDPSPCYVKTAAVSQVITVIPTSTAPTGISGTTTLCLGSSTTLTATGGSLATGSVYEWGTGTVIGSNTIAGQTANTLTITPATSTTYWVRRVDGAPCANATVGVSTAVTVNIPSGDQTTYGNTSWIGYVYAPINTTNPPTNAFTTNYRGYITQTETFNQDLASSSLTGANLCGTYADQFAIRFKMQKNFTAGYYTFTVGGDDGYRLSLDGGATFTINNFVDHAYTTTTSASFYLSGNVNLVLEYYEQGGSSRVSFSYTSCTTFSTAPTAISAPTALCNGAGGTTLTATGGFAAPGATYQWGTGSTVGSNIIAGATTSTYYVNPTTTTTYWVRRVDGAPCNITTTGVTLTITVSTPSTQPTTISATTTVCSGSSFTINTSGGTMGTGAVYQWGTGYTAGSNIIAGQTGSSLIINPTATSGYWVRRMDPAPCNTVTGQITNTISVSNQSTSPTSITGAGATACAGSNTTLTAVGGTGITGSTYQWGTGSTVGSNVIAGQTSSSITVSPATTTTYWVRRYDASCGFYSTGVTTTISITAAPGNPSVAGSNVWNVYGYSTGDITLATAVYAGYYTTNTLNFNTTADWALTASPSSASSWSGCTVPNDNFTMVAKRLGFPCGTYSILMQNWDDSAQLYLNGTLIWSNATWSGSTNLTTPITGSFTLNATSELELRIKENTGNASASIVLTNTNVASTAPTAISGTTIICGTGSTTLTATGGTTGTSGTYEWGTGTVGTNTIIGQTTASITVSPTSNTTYWVRRVDTVCGNTTSGISQLVSVAAATVAGSLNTTATTICRYTTPSPIVLTGNIGNVIKWQYANDIAFTLGVTDIASTATTLSSALIGSLTTTRYFRAVVQSGGCTIANTNPITITVPATVTYNGSWSGSPSATTPVIISGNLTLTSNLNVCSCQVTGSAIITVPANVSLIVQKDVTVAATANIIIEDKGSLVQVDDTASNIGNVTFKRNSTPLKQYDFTYWSSPLTAQPLSQLASSSLFYSFNSSVNNWAYELPTTIMSTAKGYISRAPSNLNYSTPQVTLTTFNGTPNNGIINASIVKSTGTTYNLIGNPYPSAIDIDTFLLDPANGSVINGTIYLWTHNTAISNAIPGNAIYNYTRDDYAKYNITGGVKTASTALSGGVTPTGKIAAGQGFFIEANAALANGSYQATFNNSMRVAGNNDQFFKIRSILSNSTSNTESQREKHRVWLNVSNTGGAYDETLVGYITGATNDLDNLFDGKTLLGSNVVSLYSILGTNNLAIQGRALPFVQSDVVPLGFTTTITGDFKIELEDFDGLFSDQNIYLLDKTTSTYYDLKAHSFSFNIPTSGTFDNRFELHFSSNTALANNAFNFDANSIQIIKKDKHIGIRSTDETIKSIEVYDLLGKNIFTKNKLDCLEFITTDFNIAPQILVVKVALNNNQIITKKVVMN